MSRRSHLLRAGGKLLLLAAAYCLFSLIITAHFDGRCSLLVRIFFVPTDSMEDVIPAHSLILAVSVRQEEIRVGDIYVYRRTIVKPDANHAAPGFSVVHRLIRMEDGYYVFQGDNTIQPDPPVRDASQIRYRVIAVLSPGSLFP